MLNQSVCAHAVLLLPVQPQNKAFTLKVIEETHEAYNKLKQGKRANSEELALS